MFKKLFLLTIIVFSFQKQTIATNPKEEHSNTNFQNTLNNVKEKMKKYVEREMLHIRSIEDIALWEMNKQNIKQSLSNVKRRLFQKRTSQDKLYENQSYFTPEEITTYKKYKELRIKNIELEYLNKRNNKDLQEKLSKIKDQILKLMPFNNFSQ